MNGIILPLIYNTNSMQNLGWALLIGVILYFIALIAGYILGVIDERYDVKPENAEGSF